MRIIQPVAATGATTLASSVARGIEREIIESGWYAGHFLGNEEDLARSYGVGRATLREAIRLLGHSSLVEMRRGPGGGLYVRSPPTHAVVEAMIVYFELSDLTLQEIYEARIAIDGLAVRLCTRHATDEQLARLSNVDLQRNPFELSSEMAAVSTNAALSLFLQALTRLNASILQDRGGVIDSSKLVDHHIRLVTAVQRRDEAEAADAVAQLLEIENDLASVQLGRVAPSVPSTLARNGGTALADQVALAIRRDIVAKGWPTGHVLGSESDLMSGFGVSRATFREAVRILEHHNVATMRRGPGGGLVVQRPDPGRAIDTTCRYLEHIRFDASDLRAIRDVVERSTTALAARRITPVGAARLGQALERERLVDSAEINTVSHTIHAILAELAGNRFLEFCTAVLARLTEANVDRERVSDNLDEVQAAVNLIHSRIVEAVIHGDEARASKLMGSHLEAVVEYIDLTHA